MGADCVDGLVVVHLFHGVNNNKRIMSSCGREWKRVQRCIEKGNFFPQRKEKKKGDRNPTRESHYTCYKDNVD